MRIDVEAWAPEYGSSVETDALTPSDASVDVSIEVPPSAWAPIDSTQANALASVTFVDGVRRIDARVWITHDDGSTRMGLCASYAAGLACCGGTDASIPAAEVRRGLFAPAGAPELHTRAGVYVPCAIAGDEIEQLSQGLQERMGLLERDVAAAALLANEAHRQLLVLDGPLTAKLDLRGAVGYVKSHRVSYLPPEVSAVVARLRARQRSPLFVTQGTWSRYSWYLRLADVAGHPWAGIVRCEASADLRLDYARILADRTAATLPRFASAPHKDPRAPQNLYPIAALERELRRRMGDAAWVYRALRVAAH